MAKATGTVTLSSIGKPTEAVEFDGQEAHNFVDHIVADETEMLALEAVAGKRVYRQDDGHEYVYVAAAT